jgi:hypothetical protein
MSTTSSNNSARRFSTSWLFLLFIIVFVILVRVRLLDFPLERDEGEYAYMGQLILQGIPPYSEAYNMKFPGTYLMYALIMGVFGQTVGGIHIGLILVNCAAIILVFFLGRKIVDDFAAIIAAGTYAMLSLSSSVLGFAAHATHFVVLSALGGTLLLLYALAKEKYYLYSLSGLLSGMAFIMKQPGIFFALFGVAYLLYHHLFLAADRPAGSSMKTLLRKISAFSLGAALPLVIILLWLFSVGVFDKFWFWTVIYASKYGTQVSLSQAFPLFWENLVSVADGFFLIWILSALGLVALFFHKELIQKRLFVLFFTLFSFLSICPGFYFRQHYFVTLLPAVAILAGVFIDFLGSKSSAWLKPSLAKLIGIGIFVTAALVGIVRQKDYFFRDDPIKLARSIYGGNPFPESLPVAEFIRSRTDISDRIAVLGSEPQILFYADRHSATGYLYTYGLMEIHDYSLMMQKEMIHDIESSSPKFVVLVRIDSSWLVRPGSETFILDWMYRYLTENYLLVGVADIISPDMTVYRWYEDARNYVIQSPAFLLIYERK